MKTLSVLGGDISGGTFRYEAMALAWKFACIKVTDGVGSPNPCLMPHANALRGSMPLSGYHFLRVRHGYAQDADEQCKQFMDGVANAGLVLPPWLDVELGEPGSSNRAATHDEVRAAVELFCETYEASWSTPLTIYSSPGEIQAMGIDLIANIAQHPLALAEYVLAPGRAPTVPPTSPKLPAPWTAWAYWQYAGDVPMFGGIVDLVSFNGSAEDLAALVT